MNSKWMWLLGAVSASAMLGSTACIIVSDDDTGAGGNGGAGGDTSSANVATNGTTSTGSGACVTCAEFYSNGGMGTLCAESEKIAVALDSCVCGACVAECGEMCDSQEPACDDCLKASAADQCKDETTACANDT